MYTLLIFPDNFWPNLFLVFSNLCGNSLKCFILSAFWSFSYPNLGFGLNLHKIERKNWLQIAEQNLGERMEQIGMEGREDISLGEGKSMFWLITRKSTRRL
jgi:hypothetical protein